MKLVWLIIGLVSLALGLVGALLPLLPTVPFLLLATYSFARSSDRLHNWLFNHKRLGPPIQAWQTGGVIGRRAKVMASGSILATFGISLWLAVGTVVLVIQAIVLSLVALFIWSRPEVQPSDTEQDHQAD